MSFKVLLDDGSGKVNAFLAEWVRMRIPRCRPFEGKLQTIGICRDDVLVAAAVYSDMRRFPLGGGVIDVNFAADAQAQRWRTGNRSRRELGITAPHWATKEAVTCILSLPFLHWGCTRVTAIVDKDFSACRRVLRGIGFKEEGAVRKVLPGDEHKPEARDAVIYGLLKDEFLGGRFAPKQPARLQQAA